MQHGAADGVRARGRRGEGAGCAAAGSTQQGRGAAMGLAARGCRAALLHKQRAHRCILPGALLFSMFPAA